MSPQPPPIPLSPVTTRPRRPLAIVALALGAALAIATSGPSAAALPGGSGPPEPGPDGASAPAFSINLYRQGDHVSQYTPYWCIGASMQMMLNIVGVTDESSRAAQERYMRVARSAGRSGGLDGDRPEAAVGDLRGAGSGGWARGLVQLGAGRYVERAVDGYEAAVRTAAEALRRTNRPVGLIVWRGAHAWVMSGFTATADPLLDPAFRVTSVWVQDPWYPRVSSIWGPGQKPNTRLSVAALRADFLPRRAGRWHPETAGKYVLVLPVDPVRPAAPGWRPR